MCKESLVWKECLNRLFPIEEFQKYYSYIDEETKAKVLYFIFNLYFLDNEKNTTI